MAVGLDDCQAAIRPAPYPSPLRRGLAPCSRVQLNEQHAAWVEVRLLKLQRARRLRALGGHGCIRQLATDTGRTWVLTVTSTFITSH